MHELRPRAALGCRVEARGIFRSLSFAAPPDSSTVFIVPYLRLTRTRVFRLGELARYNFRDLDNVIQRDTFDAGMICDLFDHFSRDMSRNRIYMPDGSYTLGSPFEKETAETFLAGGGAFSQCPVQPRSSK